VIKNAPRNEMPKVKNLPGKIFLICHFKFSVFLEWKVKFHYENMLTGQYLYFLFGMFYI
jgi:hypothetical protein